MSTYLEALHADISALYPEHGLFPRISTSARLLEAVCATNLNPAPEAIRTHEACTNIGQIVIDTYSHDQGNDVYHGINYLGCGLAESKLGLTMQQATIASRERYSPTFLCYNDELIGVHKSEGEKTMYALETVHELRLHAGCFYATTELPDPKSLGKHAGAYKIRLTDSAQFGFIRASTLLVPLEARLTLLDEGDLPHQTSAMTLTHTAIVAAARAALASATPIKTL